MIQNEQGDIRFKIVVEGSSENGWRVWAEIRPDVVGKGSCPSLAVDDLLEQIHEIHEAKREQNNP